MTAPARDSATDTVDTAATDAARTRSARGTQSTQDKTRDSRAGTSSGKETRSRSAQAVQTRVPAAKTAPGSTEPASRVQPKPKAPTRQVPKGLTPSRTQPGAKPSARPRIQPSQSKQPTRSSARAPLVLAVMSLLATGLVATLWLAIASVSGSYELQRAGEEITALNEQQTELMKRVSTLESTPAVQQRARELGMVPAARPTYLIVHPNGSIQQIGQPQRTK